MIRLAEELDKANIDYVWYIFTTDTGGINNDNVIYRKPTLDVRKWLQHADYVVQLSDSEACSYTINESLLLGTPLIVTPLPYLEELGIKDNENCYILSFDLSNISDVVKKIKNVPKFDNFKLPSDIYDKWIVKGKSKYKEELKMRYLVEALNTYEEGNIVDNELLRIPKEGEKWEVSRERLDVLLGENALGKVFVKVVEETKPKEEIKEGEKKTTKKTTKRK
jgi:glycosyltransferase involved in cell wall biosynthesis